MAEEKIKLNSEEKKEVNDDKKKDLSLDLEEINSDKKKDLPLDLGGKKEISVNDNKKKESSFLTSSITIKDKDKDAGTEDFELKCIQESFIEKNLQDKVLFKSKCNLFIFNKKKKKYEERGTGDIMINIEKKTNMVKVVMIRETISRFGCHHYINPKHKLIKNNNIKNGWVGCTTEDTVEDDNEKTKFYLVKFDNEDDTKKFKEEYEKGMEDNKKLLEKQ